MALNDSSPATETSAPLPRPAHARFTGPPLCAMEAHQLVALLRQKEVSPSDVLEASLARIAVVEPLINALPTLCPDRARHSLKQLESRAKDHGDHAAWLGGLPLAIKDLLGVAGVRSTWGTPGLKDFVPTASDPLVERLENRGAVIIGKSNTPEMGAGGSTSNAVFGTTRNPWNVAKNPGGSSGGAAASLAAGEVWLSHGSDLAGSLRTPGAYCGVIGMRPSPGRAGGGAAAAAFTIEGVQGPMARTVMDTALFLDAMAGFDPRQPLSLEEPRETFQAAVHRANHRVRIAYAPTLNGFAELEPEIDQILRAGLARVAAAGGVVEEDCPNLPDLYSTYITLRAFNWANLPGRQPEAVQQHYKTTLHDNIAAGRRLTVDNIIDANRNRTVLFNSMQQFLTRFDVLACPVVGLAPGPAEEEFPPFVNGVAITDYVDWLRFSFLSTATSLPSLSMPIGFTRQGMPMGIQLIGPPRGEARLLQVARAVECAVGALGRQPIDPVTMA